MQFPFPKRNLYLNIPNYFSFLRVVCIPLVMILLGLQQPISSPHYHPVLAKVAAFFFVLAGISDLVDGFFARRMKISSVFGKFLDPLADKLLHMAVFIMLIPLNELPAWLVVIFLFRELTITALRGIAMAEGVVLAADVWGKKKTALLNVALTCFLLPPVFMGAQSRPVGWVVLMMALVVSLASGVNYFRHFLNEVLEKKKNPD